MDLIRCLFDWCVLPVVEWAEWLDDRFEARKGVGL
jgi:hypothetical protein